MGFSKEYSKKLRWGGGRWVGGAGQTSEGFSGEGDGLVAAWAEDGVLSGKDEAV